ncbi:purine-nucleoside phosphorylase [Candidatus Poribacteria bacterium]|nr:purine-nucleoside phosphorylase [Candidatus Poribacteria bacterium]
MAHQLDDVMVHEGLIREAAESVRAKVGRVPSILVVAGSGLGKFAETLESPNAVSYEDLKHFPKSTVVGHAGKLAWGRAGGRDVLVMSGRKHVYEGVDVRETVVPLRALLTLGVRIVILSNAAGSVNRLFVPGDLMLITDHINNQFRNPLVGANLDSLGPRFPDMSAPYDPALQELARKVALELQIPLREGVYLASTGPTYETQAEVQMFRQFTDAVGMSTVPETLVAVQGGARVLGMSVITNSLVLKTGVVTTHEEVMETGRLVGEKFARLVAGIIARL